MQKSRAGGLTFRHGNSVVHGCTVQQAVDLHLGFIGCAAIVPPGLCHHCDPVLARWSNTIVEAALAFQLRVAGAVKGKKVATMADAISHARRTKTLTSGELRSLDAVNAAASLLRHPRSDLQSGLLTLASTAIASMPSVELQDEKNKRSLVRSSLGKGLS